jgi:hypothetical protein
VDSVDNSPQTPSCPRYPQPYDDGDLISEVLRTLPEDHNKHSLKWYNFWGEPHIYALTWLFLGCLELILCRMLMVGESLGQFIPTRNIRYVPLLVRYWLCTVESPTVMKDGNTYSLKLGFAECWTDIRTEVDFDPFAPENKKKLEVFLRNSPMSFYPRAFFEEAMVERGSLFDNRSIRIVVNAPAFSLDQREYQADIDDLVNTPLSIPCLPKQKGDHEIVFDFLDHRHKRCGGIRIPVKVCDREPLIGESVIRTLQVIGGVLGLASAIILIIEKILPMLF